MSNVLLISRLTRCKSSVYLQVLIDLFVSEHVPKGFKAVDQLGPNNKGNNIHLQ